MFDLNPEQLAIWNGEGAVCRRFHGDGRWAACDRDEQSLVGILPRHANRNDGRD